MAKASRLKSERKRKAKASKSKPDFVLVSSSNIDPWVIEVENPDYHGAGNPHRRVTAVINRRTHPITRYANSHYVNRQGERVPVISKSEAAAGLRFQQLYSQSGATIKAMDPSKEPVDGGGFAGAGYTDMQHNATKLLIDAEKVLGRAGYLLVEQVCGHGLTVDSMTRNAYETRQQMHLLRECLTILAQEWGFAQYNRARH